MHRHERAHAHARARGAIEISLRAAAADHKRWKRSERRARGMTGERACSVGAREHHRGKTLLREIERDRLDAQQRRERHLVPARAQRRRRAFAVGLGAGHQEAHAITRWLECTTVAADSLCSPFTRSVCSLPRVRGRDREGACDKTRAEFMCPPPPPPPRNGGGGDPAGPPGLPFHPPPPPILSHSANPPPPPARNWSR